MINLENVSFKYGRKKIFSDLNLNIASGGVCGLLGANGAGKTTLLNLIGGLLFADSGKCVVFNHRPEKRQPDFLREIYFVGEEIPLLNLNVNEYLKRNTPFYPKFQKSRFDKFLGDFKVPRNEKLKEMSQGNRKKFFLAFAFATNNSALIFDEPTNGLDIPSKSTFRKMLAEVIDENKIVIISMHQARDLENLIDPIVILESGKIIFNHTISEIEKKLSFNMSRNKLPGALYSEKVPGGWVNVSENGGIHDEARSMNIQLELLFNAVLNNQDRIGKLFETKACR